MLKAIFFDMDETLCGTSQADKIAGEKLEQWLRNKYPQIEDLSTFVGRYLQGIYKKLGDDFPQLIKYLPDENAYRCGLFQALLEEQGVFSDTHHAQEAQNFFDLERMRAFTFFPGVKDMLIELRLKYKLILITNGPVFSQWPKINATQMNRWVDHIIVGGEEPEEKPAASIFLKALKLAGVTAEEAIHVGDSLIADIKGANDLGILSVWVNATGIINETEVEPNYEVRKAIEIHKILTSSLN
ncbi:HAD-IA family hydrolase [Vibrio navarrensis]|uniref:HAD-IA family hydrolase n=1 Tax=Vibrio navarrensis TaxID=29495 RepID=UPI00186A77ED|nr:HAD-IA family hydrolase [Vibrio navarrensis]MBE4618711.1 HAD family hydrolase [Vibrio navarrensis]